MIKNKKILVLGLAKSGLAVTKLLYQDNLVIVTDKSDKDEMRINELKDLGVEFILSETGAEILDNTFDLVIKNPGIFPFQECVVKANKLGIKVVNEMEVGYGYLPKNVKIIGVTGSNGKTTTTTMIYDLLKKFNKPVHLGGNIGYPLCEIVKDIKENSILLLEISDHQLYNLDTFKTNISVLTNICPTHLDYYENDYNAYKNTKKKIFNHHTKEDLAIINQNNQDSLDITGDINSHKEYFNSEDNYYDEEGIYVDRRLVINIKDIKIIGNHNYENILACLLVLKEFVNLEENKEIIKEYFKTFNGVEHRIEVVDSKSNLKFYNDSKATNPTSTITALKVMPNNVLLILGGMERSQDFNELSGVISKVKTIYAIGEVTDRIYEYAQKNNLNCQKCYTLEKAMLKIKENAQNGETILLSPASASWDQYDKFESRGEEFKKLVEKLFN